MIRARKGIREGRCFTILSRRTIAVTTYRPLEREGRGGSRSRFFRPAVSTRLCPLHLARRRLYQAAATAGDNRHG